MPDKMIPCEKHKGSPDLTCPACIQATQGTGSQSSKYGLVNEERLELIKQKLIDKGYRQIASYKNAYGNHSTPQYMYRWVNHEGVQVLLYVTHKNG
jgi:hypothetical protein